MSPHPPPLLSKGEATHYVRSTFHRREPVTEKLAKANGTQHSAAMHNPEDRAFFGHPRGLGYIAFTEAWERFSYYGMQSLLILYMVNQLLHPGHIEHIAGFTPFRHFLETLYRGPLPRSEERRVGKECRSAL